MCGPAEDFVNIFTGQWILTLSMFVSFLLQEGASLSAVNCDGDVPLDIALDESTESLLQDYTLRQGEGHFSQLCPLLKQCFIICLSLFWDILHVVTTTFPGGH